MLLIFLHIITENYFPIQKMEAPKPTQNPEIPKQHLVYTNFFEKSFCLLPCDTSQEPNRNCSEKTCSDDLFFGGGGWIFRVEFPPPKRSNLCATSLVMSRTQRHLNIQHPWWCWPHGWTSVEGCQQHQRVCNNPSATTTTTSMITAIN